MMRLCIAVVGCGLLGGMGVVSARQLPVSAPCSGTRDHSVTVLFVNGIWNTETEAQASCDGLARMLGRTGVTGINVGLFYNRTEEVAWKECEVAIEDAKAREARGENVVWGSGLRTELNPLTTPVTRLAQPRVIPVPRAALDKGCDQPPDLLEADAQVKNAEAGFASPPQIDALRLRDAIGRELAAGRRVVVVAHSQGNLMFQEAAFAGMGLTEEEQRNVGWVAVSGPYINISPRSLGAFGSVVFGGAGPAGDPLNEMLEKNQTPPIETRVIGTAAHLFTTYLTNQAVQDEIERVVRVMLPVTAPRVVTNGQRILLVLDVSASMADANKMAIARQAANDLLSQLTPGTEVGIMAFGEVVPGDECSVSGAQFTSDIASLRQSISQLESGGRTPLAKAMMNAAAVADATVQDVALHVIVITDGMETCQRRYGIDPVDAARTLGLELRLITGTP